MVCFGYLRVSTVKQSIDNNKAEILLLANKLNLGNVQWIQETVSGRKDWRNRILGKEFEKMREGDIIIMSEYSRIGRDFLQSMEFLAECKRKNITVYSTIGDIKLDNSPTSNLLLAITAWKNQVEREHLSYRTKIGIQEHKNKGSILGRKKIMNLERDPTNKEKITDMLKKDIKKKTIAKELNTTMTTLKKYIRNNIDINK